MFEVLKISFFNAAKQKNRMVGIQTYDASIATVNYPCIAALVAGMGHQILLLQIS